MFNQPFQIFIKHIIFKRLSGSFKWLLLNFCNFDALYYFFPNLLFVIKISTSVVGSTKHGCDRWLIFLLYIISFFFFYKLYVEEMLNDKQSQLKLKLKIYFQPFPLQRVVYLDVLDDKVVWHKGLQTSKKFTNVPTKEHKRTEKNTHHLINVSRFDKFETLRRTLNF